MGPTPREWLGAGLLALVLVALRRAPREAAMPGGDEADADDPRALLGA